jgi:hypothetical protein
MHGSDYLLSRCRYSTACCRPSRTGPGFTRGIQVPRGLTGLTIATMITPRSQLRRTMYQRPRTAMALRLEWWWWSTRIPGEPESWPPQYSNGSTHMRLAHVRRQARSAGRVLYALSMCQLRLHQDTPTVTTSPDHNLALPVPQDTAIVAAASSRHSD